MTLAAETPFDGVDGRVVLDAVTHIYTVDGAAVPRSASAVVSAAIGNYFDAKLVISKNLASWRSNERSKYHHLVVGLPDDEAAAAIEALWANSSVLGTKMHARAEDMLNDRATPDDGETDAEWRSLASALLELQRMGWSPLRTELSLWYESADGRVVCAGQLDALFEDPEGNTVIVDFKRTAHDLSASAVPFGGRRCAAEGMKHLYANDHTRYALQLSLYSVLLQQRTGIVVDPAHRWLLQAHPELGPRAIWTRCADLDVQARALLAAF